MIKFIESRETLSQEDSLYYESVWNQLKAKDTLDLARKLKTPPNSLALAQAAIESGWGTSRVFHQANNIFGVWSVNPNEPRLKANQARKDKQVYLKKYTTVARTIQ